MSRAACIGSMLILMIAAVPGLASAGGQVRLGPVFVSSGYDHYDSYGHRRYGSPYQRWNTDWYAAHHFVRNTPYFSGHRGPRYFVFYSPPRYYGYPPPPYRHDRFCPY